MVHSSTPLRVLVVRSKGDFLKIKLNSSIVREHEHALRFYTEVLGFIQIYQEG